MFLTCYSLPGVECGHANVVVMNNLDGLLNLADEWQPVFKLISDRTRLRLLVAMHHAGPANMTVQQLADATGTRMVTASAALTTMATAGVIKAERDGRQVRYSLVDERVHRVLHHIGASHATGH